MANKQRLSFFGLLVIIVLVLAAVSDIAIFYTMPLRTLFPVTLNSNTDQLQVAAILFNDFSSTYTGINNETKRRVHHGMSLLKNNKVKQLIVVGGNREKSKRKGSQLMADYMLEQGVAKENILVETSSRDSISNMQSLELITAEKNISALGLISSPYHLLRIKIMHIPIRTKIIYSPYDPVTSQPPLSRGEIWHSAHYNFAAYIANLLMPESLYTKLVEWIRENTEW